MSLGNLIKTAIPAAIGFATGGAGAAECTRTHVRRGFARQLDDGPGRGRAGTACSRVATEERMAIRVSVVSRVWACVSSRL